MCFHWTSFRWPLVINPRLTQPEPHQRCNIKYLWMITRDLTQSSLLLWSSNNGAAIKQQSKPPRPPVSVTPICSICQILHARALEISRWAESSNAICINHSHTMCSHGKLSFDCPNVPTQWQNITNIVKREESKWCVHSSKWADCDGHFWAEASSEHLIYSSSTCTGKSMPIIPDEFSFRQKVRRFHPPAFTRGKIQLRHVGGNGKMCN